MDFILLAAGRSGSTLLTNYLSSHPHVRCHHEPFNQKDWHKELKGYSRPIEALKHMDQKGLSISNYRKIQSALRCALHLHNGGTVADPFKKDTQIESEGFKLTWTQANNMFEDISQWLMQKKHIKCIFLYRYDYLARYVSYELARSTGLWHSNSKIHNVEPFMVSKSAFEEFCEKQLAIEYRCLNLLAKSNTETFILSYEEMTKSPILKVNEVLDFIGHSSIKSGQVSTNKLVAADLDKLVLNFKALNDIGFNLHAHNKRLKYADDLRAGVRHTE